MLFSALELGTGLSEDASSLGPVSTSELVASLCQLMPGYGVGMSRRSLAIGLSLMEYLNSCAVSMESVFLPLDRSGE